MLSEFSQKRKCFTVLNLKFHRREMVKEMPSIKYKCFEKQPWFANDKITLPRNSFTSIHSFTQNSGPIFSCIFNSFLGLFVQIQKFTE